MKPILLLPIAALIAPAALLSQTSPCRLTIASDQVQGVAYHVHLYIAQTYATAASFRVRKSSTLSVKRRGVPYQHIKLLTGAWEVSKMRSTIPAAELWTSLTWRWEVYDLARSNPLTGQLGDWRRIPTEHSS